MKKSCVYFIQRGEGGPIKIGFSRNISSRLSKMQTDVAEGLKILAVVEGGRSLESEYHARFERHRIRAEWFHPVAPVLDCASELASKNDVLSFAPRPSQKIPKCPLEAWRRRNGMTGAELAEKVGASVSYFSQIETGARRPGWEFMLAIHEFSGGEITPNDFLDSAKKSASEVAA